MEWVVMNGWNELPKEVVECLFLSNEVFKRCVDMALRDMV